MKIKILSTALLLTSLLFSAQQNGVEKDVKDYSEKVEQIVTTEKAKMNAEIDEAEAKFNSGEISEQEFKDEKKRISEKYEEIINQKIDEERATLDSITQKTVSVSVFNRDHEGIVSVKTKKEKSPEELLNNNDIRWSYSFMNLAKDKSSLNPFENDSQMRIGNTHSVEVFLRRKNQLGGTESPWSINYGIAYRVDTYMPKRPNVFEENNDELYLTNFTEGRLKRSKLRNVYLTIPIEFSYVLNPKYTDYKGTRYLDATKKQFKIGAGVYAGLRMRSIIKVKYYDHEDDFQKYKNVVDTGVNTFVMGGRVMLSYDGISVFFQKDFTPIFDEKTQLPNKNNVQVGVIFGSLGF